MPAAAVAQQGLFTVGQARADGWSDARRRRRLNAGVWVRVVGDVLASADLVVDARTLGLAASLYCPWAVVSDSLAGAVWGFPVPLPDSATVMVAPNIKIRGYRLTVRRAELPTLDRTRLGGVPVTTRARTRLDLLGRLPWSDARNLWAWLVTRGELDVPQLERAIRARPHFKGNGQLRRLVAASAGGSLSAAEDLLHDILNGARVTGWVANAPVRVDGRIVSVVDLLFEAERLVIAVDGWSTHNSRQSFGRDRRQQSELAAAGYVVLRFTWDDLSQRPGWVLRTILAALAQRA